MKGAKGVLINISGGADMTLFEVDEAANRIRAEVDNENANIIFGSAFDDNCTGKIRVSVVATGINHGLTQGQINKKKHLHQFTFHSYEADPKEAPALQAELELPKQDMEKLELLEDIKTEKPEITKPKTGFWNKIFGKEEENDIQIDLDMEEGEDAMSLHKKYQAPAFLRNKEQASNS